MPIVTFVPFNKAKVVKAGATLLAAVNQAHVPLGQSSLERKLIREKMFEADERAACLAVVRGDVSITTTYW
jgi:hypothetical protein